MNTLHPTMQQALTPFVTPRFTSTCCSQCYQETGSGSCGFSHCQDHQPIPLQTQRIAALKAKTIQDWNTP